MIFSGLNLKNLVFIAKLQLYTIFKNINSIKEGPVKNTGPSFKLVSITAYLKLFISAKIDL
jgi:hypothetical protein